MESQANRRSRSSADKNKPHREVAVQQSIRKSDQLDSNDGKCSTEKPLRVEGGKRSSIVTNYLRTV